jgi:pseudo-rSAM protein
MDITHDKAYWFYVYPSVYVSFREPNKILLYNTQNGDIITSEHPTCIQLIKDVYSPENLGVVGLDTTPLDLTNCSTFVSELVDRHFGNTIDKAVYQTKPMIFLPILNLQDDVEKFLQHDEEKGHIGTDVLSYLAELDLYLTLDCRQSCRLCNVYYRQHNICYKDEAGFYMPKELIVEVLEQIKNASIAKINLVGGNLLLYPGYEDLEILLSHYNYPYHYRIHYLNFEERLLQRPVVEHICIIVTFPIDDKIWGRVLSVANERDTVCWEFLIEDEIQYQFVENLGLAHYRIVPIFNDQNIDFFRENIFITQKELTEQCLSMREIFRNQKVNINYFGKLKIYPDGTVKTACHCEALGNIRTHKLTGLIYTELIMNTAWRNVRSGVPCESCSYRYLCPPPSNYELVFNQNNLCKIK